MAVSRRMHGSSDLDVLSPSVDGDEAVIPSTEAADGRTSPDPSLCCAGGRLEVDQLTDSLRSPNSRIGDGCIRDGSRGDYVYSGPGPGSIREGFGLGSVEGEASRLLDLERI
ncbi:hypothetical protein Dimus_010203, partial [Dionaea muscipula]